MGWPTGHRVMVTGHRDVRGPQAEAVRDALRRVLERLRDRHPEGLVAVCGMALGADLEFAEVALELGVPLVAALPVEDQWFSWPPEEKARHWKDLLRAALVVSVWREPGYGASGVAQFHARNRWMLDNTVGGAVVAVWDGRRSGGTWNTVREALHRGRKVLVLDPKTGSMRVEVPPVVQPVGNDPPPWPWLDEEGPEG